MWYRRYGRWWMVQWAWDGWVSFGIHVDLKHRQRGDGRYYGPYVDLHVGCVVLSLGWQPVYAGEVELRTSVATQKNQPYREA